MSHYRLFVGCRHVGKTTLINYLQRKGEHCNKLGAKDQLQKEEQNGITHLKITLEEDTRKIKMAAEKINKVIRQNVSYQIFFVVKMKSHRIRKKDVKAIQLILGSTTNITSYKVIINKLSPSTYKHEDLEKEDRLKLLFPDKSKIKPESILSLQNKDDVKNASWDFQQLDEFVATTQYINSVPHKDTNNSGNVTYSCQS